MTTIWARVQQRVRRAPGAPLITFVDGAAGLRTELSGTSLENAAAKIANALRDEYELEPGAVVSVRLPPHWQRATWLAGIWTARCVQTIDDSGAADLIVTDLEGVEPAGPAPGGPVAVVSMHPLGLPSVEPIPMPAHDATVVVRQQPDAYLYEPAVSSDPALRLPGGRTLTQAEVIGLATDLAARWSLGDGGRLLVVDPPPTVDGWLACLAVPLAVNASVVIGRNVSDPDDLARAERVTATASL